MAKQSGIFKVKGTLGGVTFYKTKDGHLAREKGTLDGNRIKNDAAFQRTRENGAEFGRAGKASKTLRDAFRVIIKNSADRRVTGRLVREMMKIIKADATSTRGERNVLDGEVEMLTGFNFNNNAKLGSTFFPKCVPSIDRGNGELRIQVPAFVPSNSISVPAGASHCKIVSAGASIDFENQISESVNSETDFIQLTGDQQPEFVLMNQITAGSVHPLVLTMGIEFYQEVNGTKYSLKNGAFNALAVVSVSGV